MSFFNMMEKTYVDNNLEENSSNKWKWQILACQMENQMAGDQSNHPSE